MGAGRAAGRCAGAAGWLPGLLGLPPGILVQVTMRPSIRAACIGTLACVAGCVSQRTAGSSSQATSIFSSSAASARRSPHPIDAREGDIIAIEGASVSAGRDAGSSRPACWSPSSGLVAKKGFAGARASLDAVMRVWPV